MDQTSEGPRDMEQVLITTIDSFGDVSYLLKKELVRRQVAPMLVKETFLKHAHKLKSTT